MLVYDKKPDGTWGERDPVYDTEYSNDKFPSDTTCNKNTYIRNTAPNMSLYGDYAVVGYGHIGTYKETWAKTFFIKKSKETGRWFRSDGPLGYSGYAVAISDKFLITGNHRDSPQNNKNWTYVFSINEEGRLSKKSIETDMPGYKLSLTGNILATNIGVYQYYESTEEWGRLYKYYNGTADGKQRIATDGKRVIVQDGTGSSDARIYDLIGTEESWATDKPKAGAGVPVGIYGDYALVGQSYDAGLKTQIS